MQSTHDESEMAKLTLEMLKRVQLSGQEVAAYVAINNWLQAKVDATPGPLTAIDTPAQKPAN